MKAVALAMLLVAATLVVVPTAAAAPECSSVYNEFELGPVTVVQYSSCDYWVCIDGDCEWLY